MAPEITRKMLLIFEEADEKSESPHLTDRELEITMAIVRGRGNKQIARNLSISEKTVRNHISNIYKKLHVYDWLERVMDRN